jgi:hypothetical protein
MSYPVKEIWRSILSMMLSVFTAIIIFAPLNIILLILFGLIPFGDDPSANRLVYIISLLSIFISSSIGGYITGLFSDKKYWLNSTITGAILTIIYFLSSDYKINNKVFYTVALLLIIPSSLFGGYLSSTNKTKA